MRKSYVHFVAVLKCWPVYNCDINVVCLACHYLFMFLCINCLFNLYSVHFTILLICIITILNLIRKVVNK